MSGTATGNHVDIVFFTIGDRGLGNAAVAFAKERVVVHPHVGNTGFGTVTHHRFGHFWAGDNHRRVNATRDRFQIGIANLRHHFCRVGIDRIDLVSSRTEAGKDTVAGPLLAADTPTTAMRLWAEKLFCLLIDVHLCVAYYLSENSLCLHSELEEVARATTLFNG